MFPVLSQNKLMRIGGGKASLGKHFRVGFPMRLAFFFKSLDDMYFLLIRGLQAITDLKKKKNSVEHDSKYTDTPIKESCKADALREAEHSRSKPAPEPSGSRLQKYLTTHQITLVRPASLLRGLAAP